MLYEVEGKALRVDEQPLVLLMHKVDNLLLFGQALAFPLRVQQLKQRFRWLLYVA